MANSKTGNIEVIDLTADSPPKNYTNKRKSLDETDHGEPVSKRARAAPDTEKRLKPWRTKMSAEYLQIRARALGQRMFVLDRQRDETNPDHSVETVSMAGTTGNVYTIVVQKIPRCDCPHALKGHRCKHIVYVLTRVLRVPAHLEYQTAFLSSELREIFSRAPALPSRQADKAQSDGNRRPLEGECPICCEDFKPESSQEAIVYCKAGCGNNIHKECFRQWAATKTDGAVPCPYCRTLWEKDLTSTLKDISKGHVNDEGYMNVGSQLGLSGRRDYMLSTDQGYWSGQHRNRGGYWNSGSY